jgi:low affinity Fe/Cu permease
MAEFRIEQKPASISQAWRAEGSNAMTRFRVNQLPDQRGSIISDALGNLVGAMKDGVHIQAKLDELSAKLNSENDDLELVKLENLNREMMTNMGQFQTDDAVKDAGEQHKSRLEEWLKSNTQLSEDGRKRAGVMMEKMNGIYRAGAQVRLLDYRRNKIITEDRQFLEQAVAAGDFGGAEKWYAKLEQSMAEYLGKVPEFTREDVKARTASAAYLNSLQNYGIEALKEQFGKFNKREKDGSFNLDGITISGNDADKIQQQLQSRISKQIIDGENRLDWLRNEGWLDDGAAIEMFRAGTISSSQYSRVMAELEKEKNAEVYAKSEATKQKHLQNSYRIKEMLVDFSADKMTPDQVSAAHAGFLEMVNSAELSDAQRIDLKESIKRMFPKTEEKNTKPPVVNPWSTETGKEIRSLIDLRFKAGEYKFSGDGIDALAVDRKLKMYKAAEFLMQNGNKTLPEIMQQLDSLNEQWKDGEISQILNNGRVIDPEKWGKVFDSREIKELEVDSRVSPVIMPYFLKSNKKIKEKEIESLKKQGYIDKADIVEKRDDNGRVVWKLKDGRFVYADEYE